MKRALVLGANGATGRRLVMALLEKGIAVTAVVRSRQTLSIARVDTTSLTMIEADITTLDHQEWQTLIIGCDAVLSCLGHNLTLKGMFGEPRRLVTEAIMAVVAAINNTVPPHPIQVILMNTTGNSNRDIPENPPLSQRIVVAILRHLLPPHADNEHAADYLRTTVGQHDDKVEWVVVRPDGLIEDEHVTAYTLHASPIRNAIFDAGQTSRINVADFMSELVVNEQLWRTWRGKMPVIYNQ